MILAVDLGTSLTKACLWDDHGLVATGTAPVESHRPVPGRCEQDPERWTASVREACREVGERAPGRLRSVAAIGLTGARQTFAVFGADGTALTPGIVWSDLRAPAEAERLAGAVASGLVPDPGTGIPLDAGSVPAKLAWLAGHRPDRLAGAAWVLAPRDRACWWMTGEVVTDPTMASRTGLVDAAGATVAGLAGDAVDLLPPVVPSTRVVGGVAREAAASLGVAPGTPVVIGAGDRACEVLGTGSSPRTPMVSWGTTANLSVPLDGPAPRPRPVDGLLLTRGGLGGWVCEAGLSAAAAFLDWLASLTGLPPGELGSLAAASPAGARGVTAVPWLDGARAPWWVPGAGAAFAGLSSAHTTADLARAVVESVAREVDRCLGALPGGRSALGGIVLGGSGAALPVWHRVLAGTAGLPVRARRSGQAAAAGAALLAATALGLDWDLDHLDPVVTTVEPDPADVEVYRARRAPDRRAAEALVALERPPGPGGGIGPPSGARV